MAEWFREFHPVVQALAAGGFTWLITAGGAATVFLARQMPRALLDSMLGFAAGVMIAASFWSLLAPAIDMAESLGTPGWLPAGIGFLLGAGFLRLADALLPHLHPYMPMSAAEGVPTTWERTTLLVLAITLHNLPEGLAVGVAFGAAALEPDSARFAAAVALAVGIALQNFPEGMAVALPLRQAGVSRKRSFWYGQLSAAIEPVAAALGAAAVLTVRPLVPYAMAFAAGAMIYVVVEELIPEAQQAGRTDLATSATIVGFTVMMILDVALG
jgi:ZIP family zinc transporter